MRSLMDAVFQTEAYWFSHELSEEDLELPTAQYRYTSPRLSRASHQWQWTLPMNKIDAIARYPVQAGIGNTGNVYGKKSPW